MPDLKFKYRTYTLPPLPDYPRGQRISLPLVPVRIHCNNRISPPVELLVDSGADHCVLQADLARQLGIDVESGRRESVSGIEGGCVDVWFHEIRMDVNGNAFTCHCAFAGLRMPGLLGREGFFDRFTVVFEQRLERLTLKFRAKDLR